MSVAIPTSYRRATFALTSTASTLSKVLPTFAFIEPTPVKTQTGNGSKPTPSRSSQSHRLLYQGSLLISDQHATIPLEGICFIAHLPLTSPTSFLTSPLPLALESMHGRPFLRVLSVVSLGELRGRLDSSADVRLYWHPLAYHANEYFLRTIWTLGGSGEAGRSKLGVKIALGDDDIKGETDCLIVYGSVSASSPRHVRFQVARLLPHQPKKPLPRLPRPDDPLPRRPPTFGSPGRQGQKRPPPSPDDKKDQARLRKKGKIVLEPRALPARSKSTTALFATSRRAAEPPNSISTIQRIGFKAGARPRTNSFNIGCLEFIDDDVFKVPETLPQRDFLCDTNRVHGSSAQKGPEKSELETYNKTVIKKLALSMLSDRGIARDHQDFKEVFNWVTRGVGFALRRIINVQKVERERVKALLLTHIEMYVDVQEPFIS